MLSAVKILAFSNEVPISCFLLSPVRLRSMKAPLAMRNLPFSSTITAVSTIKFKRVMKLVSLLFRGYFALFFPVVGFSGFSQFFSE